MNNQLERQEQVKVIEYLELLKTQGHSVLYTATAQSTYTPYHSQRVANKKIGVRKGFPDLVIVINNLLVFCEMKKPKGGVVRPEQKVWIDTLVQAGATTMVCHGFEEFKKDFENVLQVAEKKNMLKRFTTVNHFPNNNELIRKLK